MALGAVTFQISRSTLCKKFTARPSPRKTEPNRYARIMAIYRASTNAMGRLTLNRAMHCAARTADGVSLLPMSRGRLAASRLSAVPRFAGKRASIEIPKGRKIFRHCIQRRAPRGSRICVDRRVQFVFHPRFQHIFVHGKTGKDGKDLFLPTDGFLHRSKRGEVTSYGSCLIHPSSWSFFIFSTYVGTRQRARDRSSVLQIFE